MTLLFTINQREETKMQKFELPYFLNHLIPIFSISDGNFKIHFTRVYTQQ